MVLVAEHNTHVVIHFRPIQINSGLDISGFAESREI
jgi:hypothetical protein